MKKHLVSFLVLTVAAGTVFATTAALGSDNVPHLMN